ncbi:unnamed protein product [Protopolystoma xenopodis]|uniref:Uncharacterized protein n=1 Tax=Protopolystoma xenopodis TaxID=117903 RepID=A0A448XB96_9PLAT|nr:unnamed protein product [Protopolystoma xenopodis]
MLQEWQYQLSGIVFSLAVALLTERLTVILSRLQSYFPSSGSFSESAFRKRQLIRNKQCDQKATHQAFRRSRPPSANAIGSELANYLSLSPRYSRQGDLQPQPPPVSPQVLNEVLDDFDRSLGDLIDDDQVNRMYEVSSSTLALFYHFYDDTVCLEAV